MSEVETDGSTAELLLAVESSCDETAAAIIGRDLSVRSSVVASQAALHERFGGVVPEIASRAHVERVLPVLDEAFQEAGCTPFDIAAVAVTTHPGLVGSLLVGLTAAKTAAWTLGVPLVAVNHVEGHLFACRMLAGPDVFPAVGLVVSGGHSNLYHCRTSHDHELLGSTIDDAAGEAFDKVAAMLGLPYPGGPSIQKAAQGGDADAVKLPRPMLHDKRLQFSFSGLKTAVRYAAFGTPGHGQPTAPELTPQRIANLAASFQEAAVDVLVGKVVQTTQRLELESVCVGGGVAANARLRERLAETCDRHGWQLTIAPMDLCTDNAAMAAIAWEHLDAGKVAELDVDVVPGLIRMPDARR